jgi:hypothetical protein
MENNVQNVQNESPPEKLRFFALTPRNCAKILADFGSILALPHLCPKMVGKKTRLGRPNRNREVRVFGRGAQVPRNPRKCVELTLKGAFKHGIVV